jgi:hypothetical protein
MVKQVVFVGTVFFIPILVGYSLYGPAIKELSAAEASNVKGGQGFLCYTSLTFGSCTIIPRCETKACSAFDADDCLFEYAREAVDDTPKRGCGGDGDYTYFSDCVEFDECFGSSRCSNWTSWCMPRYDDDGSFINCEPHFPGGSIINASAPNGCFDMPWFP